MRLDPIRDREFLEKAIDKGTGKTLAELYREQVVDKPKSAAKTASKKLVVEHAPSSVGDTYSFTVDYGVSVNAMFYFDKETGKRHLTDVGRKYKRTVTTQAMSQNVKVITGNVSLTLNVFRPRRVGDLSNRVKLLEDALKGVAWIDDSQVTEIHLYRHEDKEHPRIEVVTRHIA